MLTRKHFISTAAIAATTIVCGLPFMGCAASDEARVLRVGAKIDVPRFGYENPETGAIEGFEIDIAHKLAEHILGDEDLVEFTGVNVSTRGDMLDSGKLDCVLATFTITEERKERYNFSQPYYTDYLGIMVRENSSIRQAADLDGKVVAVAASSTAKEKLNDEAVSFGAQLIFAEYATYSEIMVALATGRADAFCGDKSILYGYLTEEMVLLDYEFAPQQYGVATKKENTDLALKIDSVLQSMNEDGVLNELVLKWGVAG